MSSSRNRVRFFTGCGVLALVIPSAVAAQEATDQSAAAQTESNEIIVTAQKREQRLNDVGMSITAVTGEELTSRGVIEVSQLTKIEPSLQYSPSNNGTPVYTIRGVGYFEQSLSATPAVSLYQDEVPFTYPIMTRGALLDVERVEVLKGPQGTLYGQNATGGLVNFIPASPTDYFEAGGQFTIARFNHTIVNGFISGPLGPTLTGRLSAQIEQGGAWQKSVTRDDELGDKNTKVARLLLDWEPSSSFRARLNLNGWTDNSETQAGQLVGVRFLSPQYLNSLTPAELADPAAYLPDPSLTYPDPIQAIIDNPIPPRNNRASDWTAGTNPAADQEFYQAALRMDLDVSDSLSVTSLTSYQHFEQNDVRDVAGINVANQVLQIDGEVESFFQELRLQGVAVDGRLSWIVGANYAYDKTTELDVVEGIDLSAGYLTGGAPGSLLPFAPWHEYYIINDVKAETISLFGNVDFEITDRLTAHAGIRFTDSDQSMSGCTGTSEPDLLFFYGLLAAPGTTPPGTGECTTLLADGSVGLSRETLKEDNVPFQLGLDFKVTPDSLIYGSIRKGFKAGTTPAIVPTSYLQRTPVTQESLIAYEAGFKLGLFDRALQLNGAFFHYDYRNKQLLGRIIDPAGIFGALQGLVNVPRSRENGFELQATVRPRSIDGLTLTGAVTFLDSKVTSNFINFASYVASETDTIDFFGESYPYTPRWSGQASIRYEWDLTSSLRANANISGSAQSGMTGAFGAETASLVGPSLMIKSRALLDLGVGVAAADDRWRVDIWGRNVTDAYYWNTAFYQSDTTVRYTGMPATYGVTATVRFQ